MHRFRASAFPVEDYDTTNARIERGRMQEIGVRDGDTIKITGMKSSGAVCRPVEDGFRLPNDSDVTYLSPNPVILPEIRVSNLVAQNITGSGSGLIPVTVEKVHDGAVPADRVCLMSLNSNQDDAGFGRGRLDKLVVCRNNRLYFRDAEPANSFGYQVTGVEPGDYSQITSDTAVEFVPANPAVVRSSLNVVALDRLTDVVPIVYQEDRNGVVVTIPSLEVFETGIRFFVYIKGGFDPKQAVSGGHMSTVVTLEDDLGRSYALGMHEGGGSYSDEGFEHKYEIRGSPVSPDAKRLTVTLHEIVIQEPFPRGDTSRRHMLGTRSEYSKIYKMPSFWIISGPWKATFPTKR